MKLATIVSSSCLVAAATSKLASAQGNAFENLRSLIKQLGEEATLLSTEYAAKDQEIASLIEQLTTCGGGGGLPTGGGSDSDEESTTATPLSIPGDDATSSPTSQETPTSTSINDNNTASPTLAPTVPKAQADGSKGTGGKFVFSAGQSWNYNLATPVNIEVDVDVFFIDMGQEIIDALHGEGKGVVCYVSIGTVEDWREDAKDFPKDAIGGDVDGWAGEKWVDVKNQRVRNIMAARVEMAASMNCDAIEPDNMMAYSEGGIGVSVSEAQQIEYNNWFADLVHSNGMSVGLKNAVELVPILVNNFDFALNEECHEWKECDVYEDTFLAEGKPVFNVEYNLGKSMCDSANKMGLDTIVKDYDLDASLCSCVDSSRDMGCDRLA